MKVQPHVLNALRTMELTNGDQILVGEITHIINAALFHEGYDYRLTYNQVGTVLDRLAKRGSYTGSIRQVNIKRYGVGFKVWW